MFDKVLIANRGAIACRIVRTLRRLGIRSVAVYSDADRHSMHVAMADEAIHIGAAPAAESYLQQDRIIAAARESGAQAIHPGYGFLSENASFAERCAAAGIVFVGPSPQQMRSFGLKHTARELAQAQDVPLLPGSGLLSGAEHAVREAGAIGYPVMLKSTAGGGGIGMQLCRSAEDLAAAYHTVERLAASNFSQGGVFIEKFVEQARHIEVQIFGDGRGHVVTLGERDCSVQRRNQKVIEETPAPRLDDRTRQQLFACAERLGRSVGYKSAGTVEFVYDDASGEFYFLEVNTRLQVEHGVTEQVTGVDLVEWMLRVAAGEPLDLVSRVPARGHSIQVRVYAEDPAHQFRPSSGLLSHVQWPDGVRVDHWVETGADVPAHYDPMLAKIISHGATRDEALQKLQGALAATQLYGIETNLAYLRRVIADEVFREGRQTTRFLAGLDYRPATVEVIQPGTHTSIQEFPGRVGYWDIGVPPSGPMDDLAFRLANELVGNVGATAGLELTVSGPTLKFNAPAVIALCGAPMKAELDGQPVQYWTALKVAAGSVLKMRSIEGAGQRTYLAVRGGFDVPTYMGSRATFTLGQFGGHAGRALRAGDTLRLQEGVELTEVGSPLPASRIPTYSNTWTIDVMSGPHGAPDFFTDQDIQTFFAAEWEVHYNSSRTGVRLIGPKPQWARADGGEAGLHPSNIHDNAYAIGAIDFTGDMPVILGPDGPSLGGFVCPATIISSELWKVGQLRPGDKVRFRRVGPSEPVLHTHAASVTGAPAVCYRQAGDNYLLVEYGPLVLDLELRFRVHALMDWLQRQRIPGVLELTPGIRSLQVHFDSANISQRALLDVLLRAEDELPAVDDIEVPSRIVYLPLSWDDPATRVAIDKYVQSVRKDAPWCPSNIEFIRRVNGLDSIDDVRRIVFDASYLVMGLGDVYLGAPVATPLDPRHRLVTTKYNPARTWTPENAVGIGGAYLCVYGMEGPGGYQFVGRTVQMWNRHRQTKDFKDGKQWLLRFFDQLRFYPVSADELLQMREDFPLGKLQLRVEESTLKLRDYRQFLADNNFSIAAFKAQQQAAFEAERERWRANGQLTFDSEPAVVSEVATATVPAGCEAITSPVTGSVWKQSLSIGQRINAGDELLVIEAMKMEIPIIADQAGEIVEIRSAAGRAVSAGEVLIAIKPV
ncbi:5-oxoprolinase/urea amidolyase family protein [Steroidobacter cummioxidans]|uniref:5-oxoprolinase/urea amidolyase family protein n=1 Tax=Steroidobacter cummioxidans TaxID=1803913 RepID=UPI000E322C7A|nr:5-oxoprolinase/urea amidolyase family protein [Steroidobacter cummioxidans]